MKFQNALAFLCLFGMMLFMSAADSPYAMFRTSDNWTGRATVDSAGTLSQTWIKPVRDATDAQIHFDMDTITQTGVDSITVLLYRSLFDDPDPDQWVVFDTVPLANGTSAIADITVDFKKIKFEAVSSDTVANIVEWQMWLY